MKHIGHVSAKLENVQQPEKCLNSLVLCEYHLHLLKKGKSIDSKEMKERSFQKIIVKIYYNHIE